MNEIEKAVDIFKKIDKNEAIRIIGHLDSDGICASSILIKTLSRQNRKYSLSIVQQLTEDFLKSLANENYNIYFFTDLGSSNIKNIGKYLKGKTIFILDHHQLTTKEKIDRIIHINPLLFGIEGSKDISGAGVVFLFSKALDRKNEDLAHLAIIGAIGDVQEERGFSGINNEILDIAVKNKKIRIEKNLRFFGIITRPLHKILEYSSDPFIPGISGSESNAIQFLQKLGIEPKVENRWKIFNDLSEDEKKKLCSAIILERANEENPEDIFGNLYLVVEEDSKLPTKDAKEFSTLLNACGRLDKASLGIGVCLNDKKLKEKAIKNLEDYRKEIVNAIEWFENNKNSDDVIEGENYLIINAKNNILGTMIGTLASIISKSYNIKEDIFIMSMARLDDDITKVSLRKSGRNRKEINLKEIINKITEKTGGEAGGHINAAGALISVEKEEEFINEAINLFKDNSLK